MEANGIILRTPFYPFFPPSLNVAVETEDFREAIYLASPALLEQLQRKMRGDLDEKDSEKLSAALSRYLLRMAYRCTPFGLFAGVSVGRIGELTSVELSSRKHFIKNTRLDSHFLNSWAQNIARSEDVKNSLRWFANNTCYPVLENIRYVGFHLEKSSRKHFLSEIVNSEYVSFALQVAANGCALRSLKAAMATEFDSSSAEVEEFINEMIDAKLLLSELEPEVTGEEYHYQLLDKLSKYKTTERYAQWLQTLVNALKEIDDYGPGAPLRMYYAVVDQIKSIEFDTEPLHIFQSDMIKPAKDFVLGRRVVDTLKDGLNLLERVTQKKENPKLAKFKEEFLRRYDGEELPLLTVLDAELGIGYPTGEHSQLDNTPLLRGIRTAKKKVEPLAPVNEPLDAWKKILTKKYGACLQNGSREITITDSEVDGIFKADDSVTVNSLFTICNILAEKGEDVDKGNFQIVHIVTAGPSAANLLGRFCHADQQLTDLVEHLINLEESHAPEFLFAEIVHLPEARLGNILMRPILRSYEIPILTRAADGAHSIPLSDIMISIRNDKVILRSKSLNKYIIPRLTTAHNFVADSLPPYHFLCDLQSQNEKERLSWSWHHLADFPFLPRVTYKNIILSKAKWKITTDDIDLQSVRKTPEFINRFTAYCKANLIPRYVQIVQQDNVLPLDLLNESSLHIVESELARFKSIILEEILFNKDNIFVSSPEGKFTNEFIITWTKAKKSEAPKLSRAGLSKGVMRNFPPGTSWHYVKLYCGIKIADKIVGNVLLPLTEQLLAEGVITKWFFIRYSDPHHHLRIRFEGVGNYYSTIVERINKAISPYLERKMIWNIQVDTYQRELERYGVNNIEISESIFYRDSQAIAQMLSHLEGDETDDLRSLLAFKGTDDLLSAFGYDSEKKREIMKQMSSSFRKEFAMEQSAQKKMLSDQYRLQKHAIVETLTTDRLGERSGDIWSILNARSKNMELEASKIDELIEQGLLEIPKDNLVASYIHMFLNRLFRSKQRIQEMVVYDWLYQYYNSELMKRKYNYKAGV